MREDLRHYLATKEVANVDRAYHFAAHSHRGQRRRSGEPYIVHPLEVARILASMHLDAESITAAILHDVLEDTETNKKSIHDTFGADIANLVDGLSKLDSIEHMPQREAQSHNFYKIAMAAARDVRVMMIKLADRLHNMRTLDALPLTRRKRIAKETLDLYAPIALRLGMNDFYIELEDLSFRALHPMRSRRIEASVAKVSRKRSAVLEQTLAQIRDALSQERINAEVLGRKKHLYGIYRKMSRRHLSFSQIMDVFGFRVVVVDVNDCYRALGVMHSIYKPLEGKFKDYIAIPKSNGYQSLHTTLFGQHGIRIEIQIRTKMMEKVANHGIAAHDRYKIGDEQDSDNINQRRVRHWVDDMLKQSQGNPMRLIESIQSDLFPDKIYVFSPDGDVIELPRGATAVDFAYAIHSDIGNHCIGCRINQREATLNTPLENGQSVEIFTAPLAGPHPSWTDFVVSHRARAGIRHELKKKKREEAVSLGRNLLQNSLAGLDSNLKSIDDERRQQLLDALNMKNFEDLLADIGLGNRMAALTARQLINQDRRSSWWDNLPSYFGVRSRHQPMSIAGTESLVINFGQCCSPIPGDKIIGHISGNRGLVVHTGDCKTASVNKEGDLIPLKWADTIEGEFTARLRVLVGHERGILAELANLVNDHEANVEKLSFNERDHHARAVSIAVQVRDRIHLARLIRSMRNMKHVKTVIRPDS